ncbi:MAG TPA: hypothetical protein VFP84_32800 [Kofleriaceae bacterium]|nr:hypothetical protein [Kofleriaceae bacterium]
MTSSPANPAPPLTSHARTLRARPTTHTSLPVPNLEHVRLRELLETNLQALRALHDEHQRMLRTSLQAIEGITADLRNELRAIGNVHAPWVRAMSETRALLFVALRELVVGAHEAELEAHAAAPERTAAIDAAIAALDVVDAVDAAGELDASRIPEPSDLLELGAVSDPRDFPHRTR